MKNQTDLAKEVEKPLEDANHLFPNYLSGLAHDIRTPLSAIIGFSDLLLEPRLSRADQRNYTVMIARSSRKLLDLMSNLIDLAKMETGNLELFYKPVYIKDLVEDVKMEMQEMTRLYDKESLTLAYNYPSDTITPIYTDKGRLFQIIRIVMENSLRFTKEGGISLTFKEGAGGSFTIEVMDTGCGIDKETLSNLFGMFPPADTPLGKKMKVRGLSLAVVKKLCDMLNIRIDVTSHVGTGTLVRLIVPGKPA